VKKTLLVLGAVVLIVVLPLVFIRAEGDEEAFGGADGEAEETITEIDPDYEPWFSPLWEPPGGETESLLFALQAAIGAGVIGYVFGVLRTRTKLQKAPEATGGQAPVDS
jgi:cobalt/nickel transport protein